MKELTAFVLLLVLIGMGWKQSYKNQYDRLVGNPPPATPVPVVATPAPTPQTTNGPMVPASATATPRDQSWMWEKNAVTPPPDTPKKQGGGKHGR